MPRKKTSASVSAPGKSARKVDIANKVSLATGLSVVDSSEMVDIYFRTVGEMLVKESEVKIMHLGTFIKKPKPLRIGRNPKTGAPAVIPAHNSVLFHPSKNLKSA